MIKVGLVVEGSHDIIMLTPLIRAEIKKRIEGEILFIPLQPLQDETGKSEDGGWSRVVAWCKRYAGEALETFLTPLFEGDDSCDVIVVHLDGDCLEHIGPHTTTILPMNPNVLDRVGAIVSALEGWLTADDGQRAKLAFAIPVLQTEAWILSSASGRQDFSLIDAKSRFRRDFDHRKERAVSYYQRKVASAFAQEQFPSCSSYNAFKEELELLRF